MPIKRLTTAIACTCLLLLTTTSWLCDAANWAQVSGKRQTNAAVLEITPWARRHGHSVASLDFSDDYVRSTGQKARMFVIGGDSSVQGKQDLRAYPGGGSLKNDVWATTGITWQVSTNILKTTKWGDPLPQTIANITWLQTNNGKRPPRGVTYAEWIACAANAWAVTPVEGCDDPTQPPGAYLADNMFSPRRNFVSLAFQNELFVLGGRAREHAPLPEDQVRGGVPSGEIGPRNVRWREQTVLKNDVWRSSDAGASWKLVTPGCLMPQANLVHKTAGARQFQCERDDDCEGDASCQFDQKTSTGFCVCQMWSPREFHAVVVHEKALFLSGGYALVQLGNCGVEENARKRPSGEEFACGGGYRAFMNDVWKSLDGQKWTLLTLHASFSPRGEHAMLSFQSQLYIFGGRSGDPMDANTRKLHHDIWTSSDGSNWGLHTSQAPWSPRAKHVVVVVPGTTDVTTGDDPEDEVVLLHGEDDDQALDDVWSWRGGKSDWIQDYSFTTETSKYVSVDSDVSYLSTMHSSPHHVETLHTNGIFKIRDLTKLNFEKTIALRKQMPICDSIALAKQIVMSCSIQATQNEGDEFANVHVVHASDTAQVATATDSTTISETNWDGCTQVGTKSVTDSKTKRLRYVDIVGIDQVQVLRDIFDDAQNSICKWHPSQRTGHGGVVFQRKIFVLGGLVAPDYMENDVWYRDKRLPRAQFTRTPPSGSSETLFLFESDKVGCTFEYHVLNLVESLVVRNWTKTLGSVDFLGWLDGGKYQFRVRAVDAAGNVDLAFETGRNEHVWVYKPALPWGLILGLASVLVVVLLGMGMEWRKRRKRAAMERYAMKRMRRKVKGTKKNEDANWRETYDTAKDATGKKKTKGKGKGKVAGVKKDKDEEKKKKTKETKANGKDKDKTKEKKTKAKDKDKAKEKDKKAKDKKTEKTKAKTKDKKEEKKSKPVKTTTKDKDKNDPSKTKKSTKSDDETKKKKKK